MILHHPEHDGDDIAGRVPHVVQRLHPVIGLVNFGLHALANDARHKHGMGLIAHLEHVVLVDQTETVCSGLQAVERLTHIPVRRENDRLQPVIRVRQRLCGRHRHQPVQNLLVRQLLEPDNRTPGLNWLDDLRRHVAREGKPRGFRVQLHGTPQCLLRRGRHRVGLVEDDNLVAARRQADALLRKHLDLVPHHIDAAIIRGVQLEHPLLVFIPQKRPSQAHDRGGLPSPRRPRQDHVRHIALLRDDLQT
mmetsp:Transcript_7986/g.21682  ORF Transcript_7986/g.21682 Transcript_7986/m.21682 type:complete len:249 (-) Transcript_7986:279-1025(-)